MNTEPKTLKDLMQLELSGIEAQLQILEQQGAVSIRAVHLEILGRLEALQMLSRSDKNDILKIHHDSLHAARAIFRKIDIVGTVQPADVQQYIDTLRRFVHEVLPDILQ